MCPFCLATAAVAAASATGNGGLAALVGIKLIRRSALTHFTQDTDTKEVEHGDDDDGLHAVKSGVAQRVD
jgi:hypothetical protein